MAVRTAWGILLLSTLVVAAFFALLPATPGYAFLGSLLADSIFAVGYLAYAVVGALIVRRQPRLIVGWLLALVGLTGTLTMLVDRYAAWAVYGGADVPLVATAAWLGGWLWMPGDVAITTFLPLLFPSGSLPSKRWRPVALVAGLAMALGAARALKQGPVSENFPSLANPYALPGALGEAIGQIEIVLFFAWALATVLSIAALVVRLRRSRGIERQQLKWFGSAMAFLGLSFVASILVYVFVGYSAAAGWITGLPAIGITLLPLAAGVAILRYRLYEIDVIIRRTLVYGALSVTLLATYVALIGLVQATLRPVIGGSELAVAGSTLGVVALVQPMRRRIQSAVDRRFYRSRYDASRTLDVFVARLRDEVGLDQVRNEVLEVIATTVRPAHAGLWLREEGPPA